MKTSVHVTLISALLISGPNPATAGWQKTEWGMSEAEIASVSGLDLSKPIETEFGPVKLIDFGKPLLVSPYTASGVKFDAFFYFKDGKLGAIRLALHELDDGIRVLNALELTYGAPFAAQRQSAMDGQCRFILQKWRDEQHGNYVQFDSTECETTFEMLNGAGVTYRALADSDNSGL